jgi:hypothetical protein
MEEFVLLDEFVKAADDLLKVCDGHILQSEQFASRVIFAAL